MNKKIAVINDLSGLGRCSLTAAISVIAAMGASPCPLPTSILSAQTGYPCYFLDDYTEKMERFRKDWKTLGQTFDGIYTGFVSSEAQVEQIFRFIDTFRTKDTFLLVDPVMGDGGETFPVFYDQLRKEIKKLALCADIITPNLTELCLLTGASYKEITSLPDIEKISRIESTAKSLFKSNLKQIIVTGIHFSGDFGKPMQDNRKIGNLYVTRSGCQLFTAPQVGGSYSGTGDLFASCLCGGIARGDALPDIIETAVTFLCSSLADTVKEQTDRNDGIDYEKHLHMLMQNH